MDAGMRISIIAAVADNGVIGRGGDLPWRIRADLRRFKQLTYGHTVIVGRKTHEAILRRLGHPLEGRRTIVVTRQPHHHSQIEVASSLKAAFVLAKDDQKDDQEVFVIGGYEIYRLALPYASRFYLTRVHALSEGDARFPEEFREDDWQRVSVDLFPRNGENEYDFTFLILEREPPQTPSFVELSHARFDDQREVMERIAREGICPFCPKQRTKGEVLEPVWRSVHWVLVPNRWPYEFTTLHLMAIAERHVRMISELTAEEWSELRDLLVWVEARYGLDSGAIGIRFGDPAKNGATVDHLHAHFIVADPDTGKPGYERVHFPMGPKPPQPK